MEKKIAGCEDELDIEGYLLDIEKINIHKEVEEGDYELAKSEVEFLTILLDKLEVNCNWNFNDITREQGYQLAQQEERKLILLERVRIGLLSTGVIDSETLREVKSHPEMASIEKDIMAMVGEAKEGKLRLTHNEPMLILQGSEVEAGKLLG